MQILDIFFFELYVSIGGFFEDINGQIDEYCIGFFIGGDLIVVYGMVWLLYEQESGEDLFMMILIGVGLLEGIFISLLQQILMVLCECGIVYIKYYVECFIMEFCDDCGVLFFFDWEGELVYVEMLEDMFFLVEYFY